MPILQNIFATFYSSPVAKAPVKYAAVGGMGPPIEIFSAFRLVFSEDIFPGDSVQGDFY